MIDVTQAKKDALARFADTGPGHANCAQAVLHFSMQVLGEDPELVVAARYFGGGMCGLGEACGALTGAFLSLGIRDYRLPEGEAGRQADTSAALKILAGEFCAQFGASRCRDLTGFDLTTKAGFDEFKKSPICEKCHEYVSWACDRLAPILARGI